MNKVNIRISVVIPAYNEEKYIEKCLSTLLESDYPKDEYEIIVIDNGSTDRSVEIARKYTGNVFILPNENVGAVRNLGAANAHGEILAFLDSDCLIGNSWLKDGAKLIKHDQSSVFGGNLFLRENPTWLEKYWILQNPLTNNLQQDLLGSCVFIQKKHFFAAGGFNTKMTSGEDSDFTRKIRGINLKIKINPTIGVVHLGYPTTITDFTTRQIWHSENYLQQYKNSIKDITFWLSFLFSISILTLLLALPTNKTATTISSIAIITIPAIFSAKRISRANFYKSINLTNIMNIYFLDFLYILGRSIGIAKSSLKFFK